jgi:Mn-dependent DtxR family transcriptional regulator
VSAPAGRQQVTEPRLRVKFASWLAGLDDDQAAALAENWENVMNDAALDRVDSWVIMAATLAKLRAEAK